MPTLQHRFWQYTADNAPKFEHLRRPGPTRALVTTYFVALGIALAAELAALWWIHFIWVFFPAMIIAMVAWTILRSTIDAKDMAPRDELDGYEAAVLARWRCRSLAALNALLLIGGTVTIVLGVGFSNHLTAAAVATLAGLYMIFAYLAVSTLPAVGYALTFNHDADKE